MKLEFLPALGEDRKTIEIIHRCAFKDDFQRYYAFHDYQESIERMSFLGMTCYIVKADGEVAGDIVLRILRNKSAEIELLAVLPQYQGRHIGRAVLRFIEYKHTEVSSWDLITPAYNHKVCGFYEKNGYIKTGDFNRPSGLLMNIYQKRIDNVISICDPFEKGDSADGTKVYNASQAVVL